jgi:cell division transport system permease protein
MPNQSPHTKIYLKVEQEQPAVKTKAGNKTWTRIKKSPLFSAQFWQSKNPFPHIRKRFQKKTSLTATQDLKLKATASKKTWFQHWQTSLGRSLVELRRNILRSLATILIISLVLSTLSVAMIVSFVTEQGIKIINTKIDLSVEVLDTVTLDKINPLIKEIEVLPYVTKVVYISKNQALEDFRQEHPDLPDFLTTYNITNPLPANLRISLTDPKRYADMIDFLDQKNNVSLINIGKARDNYTNRDRIEQLISITDSVKRFLYLFITIFAAIGVLIIVSTVQLSLNSRKKELSIMQVVGASYQRILAPFAIEATILSTISTLIALAFLWIVGQRLSPFAVQYFATDAASIVSFIQLNAISITILFILVAFSITLITTWLTVWKYLRSQKLF